MAILPIESLTVQEFDEFKTRHLNANHLSEETLKELERLFAVGRDDTGRIACDDYHPHSYQCNLYTVPIVGAVDRLISEIRTYKTFIKDLKEDLKALLPDSQII